MELANLIANLKNERYFDYRLQKIKEMEEVDKYLQSKGIIEKSDMRYFAIINDNWDNASGPTRLSGSRLSMGYSPFVIIYRDSKDYNPTTWNPDNIIHHRLFINYTYEKPKSLKLQKSFRSAIEYTRRIYQTKIPNSSLNEDITDYYSAYTQYGIGFYPNSRTSVICNVGIDFHQRVGDFTNRDNYEYTINPYIGGSFYYYFSPQLRIDASARFSYSYTKHKNVSGDVISYPYYHESDNYLKIGFVYSIF